jgi:hypothetical protein
MPLSNTIAPQVVRLRRNSQWMWGLWLNHTLILGAQSSHSVFEEKFLAFQFHDLQAVGRWLGHFIPDQLIKGAMFNG